MANKSIIIKNAIIYEESERYTNSFIKIENEKITEIGKMEELDLNDHPGVEIIDCLNQYKIVPGMIDVHIHGVAGADTMDGTHEALDTMVNALPKEGTTSFLATTITQSTEMIETALKNAGDFIHQQAASGNAEILGVHLEGPFICEKRAGAQPAEHIISPDIDLFNNWQSLAKDTIKLVTLAPEEENGYELVRHLKSQGIIASIGHSDATIAEVSNAVQEGATHVTHLFNGMRGLHHREPGTVGAALTKDELFVEIIADGIHIHPETINLAYQLKTSEKIILITDSLRAKGLKNGTYDLGGHEVTVTAAKATLADGTLAGSILPMIEASKNFMKFTDCSLEEIIQMTAMNPAKQLDVFNRKGSIRIGKDADLVILNEDHEIMMTFCRGHLAYQKN